MAFGRDQGQPHLATGNPLLQFLVAQAVPAKTEAAFAHHLARRAEFNALPEGARAFQVARNLLARNAMVKRIISAMIAETKAEALQGAAHAAEALCGFLATATATAP